MTKQRLITLVTTAIICLTVYLGVVAGYSISTAIAGYFSPELELATPQVIAPPVKPTVETIVVDSAVVVERYETVADYFKAGYGKDPISHRLGLPRYDRNVSSSLRRKIIERDGGCCLVCGSTRLLEVDHRRALMNNGDNSPENLGTLCDDCHNKKTRLDYKIRKQRRKVLSKKVQTALVA